MRGILERAKANAAELEPASWQVACITRHFTGIYACRSQGHFAVSLVARQGATCMECTVRQRHGQRPFCTEVRLMTQKSGAWGRKAHGLSCVKKEGETRAAHSSQVDQKTTRTDGVTWLHLQHTQGLGLPLFLKETSASCGGEWLTPRPTVRASWMWTHSPPAWWGTFGDAGRDESVSSSMSEWEEGGLVDFFFPKACLNELLSWKEERNDPSCLCACGEFGFGALVCRCYPSHCLGSVRTSRVLTGAARYL